MDEGLIDRIRQSIQSAPPPAEQQTPQAEAAPATPTPPTTGLGQSLDEVAQGNRDTLKGIGNVVVGGARDAVQGVWDMAGAVGPAVSSAADKAGLNVLGLPPLQAGSEPKLPEVPRADESTTGGVAANAARDVERFFLGFLGGSMMLRSAGVATNTFKGSMAAGALGDFMVTGAKDKVLLGTLFDAIPALEGPVQEALNSEEPDAIWAKKLASTAEGAVFGGAIEGLVRGVGALRKVWAARKTGAPEAVRAAVEAAEPELKEALKEVQAWHGSPHDFDKFEIRPFTGEGSQAYGHGIYVAENKSVAKYYQNLQGSTNPVLNEIDDMTVAIRNGTSVEEVLGSSSEKLRAAAKDYPGFERDLSIVAEGLEKDGVGFAKSQAGDDGVRAYQRIQESIKSEGNLYEVKVKAKPEEMLDWDAPLSSQAAPVRAAFGKLADVLDQAPYRADAKNFAKVLRGDASGPLSEEITGEQLYRALSTALGGGDAADEAASKALLDAGVPGLRFLDAGSRGGDPTSGTRNMVLFDPKYGEVVSKNGAAIPTRAPVEVSPSGQIEMFPEVVRREEAIQDIQLQIKGDRYVDPETGKEKLLPISNRAREELTTAFSDPSSALHIDKLTPETRDELLRALASDNETARFFNPKTVRGKPFALDDTRRADFDAALERSLTVPYATLKAASPGTAIEDTLSTFLNYRYMDSADSVKVALDDMANVMKPMVDKHLGGAEQTFGKVQELADWIGSKPETLTALLSQQARAAEYMPALLVAGKTWIQSLTRDITQISKQIAAGTATDTAKVELVRRQDILGDLISTLKAVQTSSARTTAAGRIRTSDALTSEEIATLIKEIGEDNFKVLSRRLSITEGDPRAVISILEPTLWQKGWGVANEVWINGLLSGLGTHVVNFATGTRNVFLYPAFRIAGGALTGDMQSIKLGLGQYAGLRGALFDSFEMAKRSLLTENAYVDASFHQVERERNWIKGDTFGLNEQDFLGRGVNALGTAIRMSTRFLTSEDEFLKQLVYRSSVTARARIEAVERGLSDTKMVSYYVDGTKREISEVEEYVRDRLNEAFHPRLEHGLDEKALADARRATFTSPLAGETWGGFQSLGEMAQQAAARNPVLRHTILPFTRVPANVFREMIYESPLAPIKAQFWADLKAGGEARADAVGRMALGSAFWTGATMLALEGVVTGKGPTDPQLQKQLRATGWQPYSFVFRGMGPDGKDLYISYNRFDPTAGMLGIAADMAYVMAHVDERTQDQLAMTTTMALANNLNSRGYLRSLTELSAILGQTNNPQAPNLVQRWLNSRASSYVPRWVSSLNSDDGMHEPRTMLEAVYAKIPGLSSSLPPMRDNFGEAMFPAIGWPYKEVNPFSVSLSKEGKARKELAYWAESPVRAQFEMPHSRMDGVMDLRDFVNERTGQNAYDRWLQILTEPKFGGKTMEERLDEIVASDGYKTVKSSSKEDAIYRKHPAVEFLRDQMNQHYKMAQMMMLQEKGFEPLRQALQQHEQSKIAVPAGVAMPSNPTLDELLKR